jgi:hypothetical protein
MSLSESVKSCYLNGGLGIKVRREAAADAVGPTTIFTVNGGYVLLTGLYGVVTTARTGGGAVTQVFTHTATNLCAATITGLATIGTVITLTGTFADNLLIGVGTGVANTTAPVQGGLKGSAAGGEQMYGVILGVGNLTTTISVVTAGATRYVLTYIPIDDVAHVISA